MTIKTRTTSLILSALSCSLLFAACGDDTDGVDNDDAVVTDSGATTDAGTDAVVDAPENADSSAAGACGNSSDLALLDGLGGVDVAGATLGCETAVCVNQNLDFVEVSIDEEGTRECAGSSAPELQTLSNECRSCYVDLALCIPRECVEFFGGESACLDVPPSDFEACSEPSGELNEECATCQEQTCVPDFLACAGF
ncbi:MAG: hypothetical protein ACJAYU_002104 [Bradymonadia bacterium]|jgi:hypothetical protein